MAENVLITGANKGIGNALVEHFSSNGYNVIACMRKYNPEVESKNIEREKKYCVKIWNYYFDLENEQEIKETIRNIIKEVRKIEILINNAGISDSKLFQMLTMDEAKKSMQINYFAPLQISQLVARLMVRQKAGCIVNIASVSGMVNEIGRISYGASKAALIFATKTLSKELAPFHIRVNCISPGFIDTDMWRTRDVDLYNKVLEETPIGRQGNVDDVINAIDFLVSKKSSYITGQNIIVDGGRMV